MRDRQPMWRDAYGVWHVFRYAEISLTPGVPLRFYSQGIFAARNVPVTVRPA